MLNFCSHHQGLVFVYQYEFAAIIMAMLLPLAADLLSPARNMKRLPVNTPPFTPSIPDIDDYQKPGICT